MPQIVDHHIPCEFCNEMEAKPFKLIKIATSTQNHTHTRKKKQSKKQHQQQLKKTLLWIKIVMKWYLSPNQQ